jgi:hypothetical protein
LSGSALVKRKDGGNESESAILEIPEVRQRVSPLSVAEYHRLGEDSESGRRTELIGGMVIDQEMRVFGANDTIECGRIPDGRICLAQSRRC